MRYLNKVFNVAYKLRMSLKLGSPQLLPDAPRFVMYTGRYSIYREAVVLDRYNLAAFVLHGLSAVILFSLTINNDSWPVYSTVSHFKWEPVLEADKGKKCDDVECKITSKEEVVDTIPMEWLVVVFHAMSVIAHFGNRFLWRDSYYRWLCKKMNPGRWLEYFFSASIMQVVLQVLTGYTNVWILVMSAVSIGVTQVFGHATEQILYYSSWHKFTRVERWSAKS